MKAEEELLDLLRAQAQTGEPWLSTGELAGRLTTTAPATG